MKKKLVCGLLFYSLFLNCRVQKGLILMELIPLLKCMFERMLLDFNLPPLQLKDLAKQKKAKMLLMLFSLFLDLIVKRMKQISNLLFKVSLERLTGTLLKWLVAMMNKLKLKNVFLQLKKV